MGQSEEETDNISSREERWQKLSRHDQNLLIEEYKELSEEVRYRDGLMHNSYYLLAIALVFFLGNIINWIDSDLYRIVGRFPEFLALFGSISGILLIFVGTVMKTYNRKRVTAERRRRDIEEALNRQVPADGSDYPPFGIQREVLRGKLSWIDDTEPDSNILFQRTTELIDSIINRSIGTYSVLFVMIGVVLASLSAFSMIYLIVF